ncbi:MAG: hypothetical protein ACLFP6_06080 [Spirochaetaceae bacterium]
MAANADLTILVTLPPLNPRSHWELIASMRRATAQLPGRSEPLFVAPADPNLSVDPERLPDDAYRLWKSIPLKSLAAAGYTGAPELALTAEELSREVTWTGGPPKGCGTTIYGYDRLGAPFLPDLKRLPRSLPMILGVVTERLGERLLLGEGEKLYSLPLLRLRREPPPGEKRELRRLIRRGHKEGTGVVVLLETEEEADALNTLNRFCALVGGSRLLSRSVSVVPLERKRAREEGESALVCAAREQPIGGSPFSVGMHRALRGAAQARQLSGPTNERHRLVLEELRLPRLGGAALRGAPGAAARAAAPGPTARAPSPGATARAPREERNAAYGTKRTYTAAMHGLAQIVGERFDLRTDRGRPAALVNHDSTAGVGEPGVSTLRERGSLTLLPPELCSIDTISAFSFEGELSRGLREESIVRGALSGRVRLDSYFLSEYEELFLALELRLAGALTRPALLTPVEFALGKPGAREDSVVTVRRSVGIGEPVEEELRFSQKGVVPLFASEASVCLPALPPVRVGVAELWKEAIAPMALARVPGEKGREARLVLDPFGAIELPADTEVEVGIRRTMRITLGAPFGTLSRGLESELLLWEDPL